MSRILILFGRVALNHSFKSLLVLSFIGQRKQHYKYAHFFGHQTQNVGQIGSDTYLHLEIQGSNPVRPVCSVSAGHWLLIMNVLVPISA